MTAGVVFRAALPATRDLVATCSPGERSRRRVNGHPSAVEPRAYGGHVSGESRLRPDGMSFYGRSGYQGARRSRRWRVRRAAVRWAGVGA